MIKLDYKIDKPLHEQISDGFKELIVSGILKTDDQLPSVREMSLELTVNPNTVQRAYKSLESDGIIYSVRGKGNFVAKAESVSSDVIGGLYDTLTSAARELSYLGEPKENLDNIIKNIYSERND